MMQQPVAQHMRAFRRLSRVPKAGELPTLAFSEEICSEEDRSVASIFSFLSAAIWMPQLILCCGDKEARAMGGRNGCVDGALVQCICHDCSERIKRMPRFHPPAKRWASLMTVEAFLEHGMGRVLLDKVDEQDRRKFCWELLQVRQPDGSKVPLRTYAAEALQLAGGEGLVGRCVHVMWYADGKLDPQQCLGSANSSGICSTLLSPLGRWWPYKVISVELDTGIIHVLEADVSMFSTCTRADGLGHGLRPSVQGSSRPQKVQHEGGDMDMLVLGLCFTHWRTNSPTDPHNVYKRLTMPCLVPLAKREAQALLNAAADASPLTAAAQYRRQVAQLYWGSGGAAAPPGLASMHAPSPPAISPAQGNTSHAEAAAPHPPAPGASRPLAECGSAMGARAPARQLPREDRVPEPSEPQASGLDVGSGGRADNVLGIQSDRVRHMSCLLACEPAGAPGPSAGEGDGANRTLVGSGGTGKSSGRGRKVDTPAADVGDGQRRQGVQHTDGSGRDAAAGSAEQGAPEQRCQARGRKRKKSAAVTPASAPDKKVGAQAQGKGQNSKHKSLEPTDMGLLGTAAERQDGPANLGQGPTETAAPATEQRNTEAAGAGATVLPSSAPAAQGDIDQRSRLAPNAPGSGAQRQGPQASKTPGQQAGVVSPRVQQLGGGEAAPIIPSSCPDDTPPASQAAEQLASKGSAASRADGVAGDKPARAQTSADGSACNATGPGSSGEECGWQQPRRKSKTERSVGLTGRAAMPTVVTVMATGQQALPASPVRQVQLRPPAGNAEEADGGLGPGAAPVAMPAGLPSDAGAAQGGTCGAVGSGQAEGGGLMHALARRSPSPPPEPARPDEGSAVWLSEAQPDELQQPAALLQRGTQPTTQPASRALGTLRASWERVNTGATAAPVQPSHTRRLGQLGPPPVVVVKKEPLDSYVAARLRRQRQQLLVPGVPGFLAIKPEPSTQGKALGVVGCPVQTADDGGFGVEQQPELRLLDVQQVEAQELQQQVGREREGQPSDLQVAEQQGGDGRQDPQENEGGASRRQQQQQQQQQQQAVANCSQHNGLPEGTSLPAEGQALYPGTHKPGVRPLELSGDLQQGRAGRLRGQQQGPQDGQQQPYSSEQFQSPRCTRALHEVQQPQGVAAAEDHGRGEASHPSETVGQPRAHQAAPSASLPCDNSAADHHADPVLSLPPGSQSAVADSGCLLSGTPTVVPESASQALQTCSLPFDGAEVLVVPSSADLHGSAAAELLEDLQEDPASRPVSRDRNGGFLDGQQQQRQEQQHGQRDTHPQDRQQAQRCDVREQQQGQCRGDRVDSADGPGQGPVGRPNQQQLAYLAMVHDLAAAFKIPSAGTLIASTAQSAGAPSPGVSASAWVQAAANSCGLAHVWLLLRPALTLLLHLCRGLAGVAFATHWEQGVRQLRDLWHVACCLDSQGGTESQEPVQEQEQVQQGSTHAQEQLELLIRLAASRCSSSLSLQLEGSWFVQLLLDVAEQLDAEAYAVTSTSFTGFMQSMLVALSDTCSADMDAEAV